MSNWDDLRFVLAVCRGGGVTGAARALGVNHATVSRRIAALEERLGARLFDRLPSGYSPTAAGEEALVAAEAMEQSASIFDRNVAARDRRPSGVVTVTAPLMIAMGPFTDALAAFRQAYPEIEVRVRVTTDLLNLHRREADVAIRSTDAPDEGLFGLRLTEMRATLYASQRYLADRAETLAAAPERTEIDWIGRNNQERPPAAVMAVFPKARTSVCFDDKLGALAAVKAGLGLCRLPCFQGDREPELRRVPGFPLGRYPDKWILTHPDLAKVERVRLFMRFAAEAVKRQRPLFMGERPQS